MKELRMAIAAALLLFAGKLLSSECTIQPYVGVGLKYHQMNFQKGYGRNELKKTLPNMDIVLGAKVHEFLELEIGTHFSKWAKKADTKVRTFGTFARAIGLIPLSDKTEMMLGMGMTVMNVDYKLKNQPQATIIRHPVPHALIGTKLKLTDWLAFRALGSIEGTRRKKVDEKIKTNHSHALHGGLVAYF